MSLSIQPSSNLEKIFYLITTKRVVSLMLPSRIDCITLSLFGEAPSSKWNLRGGCQIMSISPALGAVGKSSVLFPHHFAQTVIQNGGCLGLGPRLWSRFFRVITGADRQSKRKI